MKIIKYIFLRNLTFLAFSCTTGENLHLHSFFFLWSCSSFRAWITSNACLACASCFTLLASKAQKGKKEKKTREGEIKKKATTIPLQAYLVPKLVYQCAVHVLSWAFQRWTASQEGHVFLLSYSHTSCLVHIFITIYHALHALNITLV